MNSSDKLRLLENAMRISESINNQSGSIALGHRNVINLNDVKKIYNELKTLLDE